MLRRISKILLLALCTWLLTGPLALLQLGAWTWMLASYSQEGSFEQAIIDTFGDERPCDVCRVIDAVETNESKGANQHDERQDLKLMLGLGRAVQIQVPAYSENPRTLIVCKPENARLPVPTPPPRAV